MITNFGPGPQGLDVKPLRDREGAILLHPYLEIQQFDPKSLLRPGGADPFLVLADGKTIRAVRADHAAEMLLPESKYRESQFRLATDAEVAAYLAEEKRKSDEYRAAEEARINREAEEARHKKLAELGLQNEVQAAQRAARR